MVTSDELGRLYIDATARRYVREVGTNGRWIVFSEVDSSGNSIIITPEQYYLLGQYVEVEHVNMCGAVSIENAIPHLATIGTIRSLDISGTSLCDADLSLLVKINGLKELDLSGTQISDAGVSALLSCHHLQVLICNNTILGDSAARTLAGIETLEFIEARDTNISAAGRQYLEDVGIVVKHKSTDRTDGGVF